jgi:hypothetical protein
LRAKFEDVIDPGRAVAEGGLGDDVEGFERGDGVGGGVGAGGERDEKRQRGDPGGRVDREAQGAGSFWTSRRHRGQYTLGGGWIEEGANGEYLRVRLSMGRKNWERRFAGCAGIEGEILRCAQNDGVTAKTKATGNSKWPS